jgi:hypothetical protein
MAAPLTFNEKSVLIALAALALAIAFAPKWAPGLNTVGNMQSFVENKSAGSANHSLANHLRPSNRAEHNEFAKELSEAHNHSIYDKHFNMMRSGGALEAQYQYGVGANNILLNHSQRLRILQNGGP